MPLLRFVAASFAHHCCEPGGGRQQPQRAQMEKAGDQKPKDTRMEGAQPTTGQRVFPQWRDGPSARQVERTSVAFERLSGRGARARQRDHSNLCSGRLLGQAPKSLGNVQRMLKFLLRATIPPKEERMTTPPLQGDNSGFVCVAPAGAALRAGHLSLSLSLSFSLFLDLFFESLFFASLFFAFRAHGFGALGGGEAGRSGAQAQ